MLSSTLKGMLVAAANVWAVAIVAGAVDLWGAEHGSNDMMFMIAILGLGPALAVGAITGYIAGELPVFRRLTLCAIGLASVIGLGAMTEPDRITQAIPTTVILALVLERWSRRDLEVTLAAPKQPASSPIWLGMWLGMINAICVSLVFALSLTSYDDPHGHSEAPLGIAILMGCLGILPGAGIGAALGSFTKSLTGVRPLLRVLVIGALGLAALTIFLAVPTTLMFGHHHGDPLPLFPAAMLPTMISVLILERRTRPPERMPTARALA